MGGTKEVGDSTVGGGSVSQDLSVKGFGKLQLLNLMPASNQCNVEETPDIDGYSKCAWDNDCNGDRRCSSSSSYHP